MRKDFQPEKVFLKCDPRVGQVVLRYNGVQLRPLLYPFTLILLPFTPFTQNVNC